MARSKSQKKALSILNYDLFQPKQITPMPPAQVDPDQVKAKSLPSHIDINPTEGNPTQKITGWLNRTNGELPPLSELSRLFDLFNLLYFGGKLPSAKIEYSNRMSSAGSYTPSKRLIKIGRKYHQLFPGDLEDTLKHEMIHIIHYRHNAAFKKEAARIGATVKAQYHPSLTRKPKYLYKCPNCNGEYPRQKIYRMASCGNCSKNGKYDKKYKLILVK